MPGKNGWEKRLREKIADKKKAERKNGRRIKRNLTFTPDCYLCVKYPAEHALKLKGVQVAEPPGRGLGAEGPGGGRIFIVLS